MVNYPKKMNIAAGLLVLTVIIYFAFFAFQKPSDAWITANRVSSTTGPYDAINVSLTEIAEYNALLDAMENGEKHHYTNAFHLNASTADDLLLLLESNAHRDIEPFLQRTRLLKYHLYIRVTETQRIYSVSISYQKQKPLIA